jgi:hypothetical protein
MKEAQYKVTGTRIFKTNESLELRFPADVFWEGRRGCAVWRRVFDNGMYKRREELW